ERCLEVFHLRPGDRTAFLPDALGLINRREKRAAVVLRAAKRARWRETDEARQVLVFRAQTVERPRAERGPHELEAPGVHFQERLRMARQIGLHTAHEAELVGVP